MRVDAGPGMIDGPRLPDPAGTRLILIGTATYADPRLHDLPAVANNLAALLSALTDPAIGACLPAHCTTIADSADPSRVGVTLAEEAAAAEDTLIVYYAGHGLVDERGELHLGLGRTNPDHPVFTSLPFEWVRRAIAGSPARNRVLLLDCCFSGLAIETMADPSSAGASQIAIAGTYTMTSSPANRPSIAPADAEHTAFTGELLSLLRRGIPGGGDVITLSEAYRALLQAHTAAGLPKPQQRNTETAEQLALAKNVAVAPVRTVTARAKHLHKRHLPPAHLQPNPRWVPIGYHVDGALPAYLDFFTDQHLVVLGDAGAGKTNVLRAVVGGLAERWSAKELLVMLFDFRRTLLGFLTGDHLLGYGVNATQVTSMLEEVVLSMRKRHGGHWPGPELVLVIDDYEFVRGQENLLEPLAELLPAAHETGLHLVVAAEPHSADPLLTALADGGAAALLMNGEGRWGSVAQTPKPTGFGTLVREAGFSEVQIAWTPYEQAGGAPAEDEPAESAAAGPAAAEPAAVDAAEDNAAADATQA